MHRVIVSALALGAAWSITGSPAVAAGHRKHPRARPLTCATGKGSTVFRAGAVRLLTMGPAPIEYQSEVTTRMMGCLKPRGRLFFLDYISQAGGSYVGVLESPRAAAPYAAYALQANDEIAGKYGQPSTSYISVRSVNLRTGRTVASAHFVQQPGDQSATEAAVPNLQTTSAGWIAWVLSSAHGETLYAYDSTGQRTLDSGTVDPKSLQISGTTVTWTNAGMQHSATLG